MFLDAIGDGGLVIDRILAINMEYEKQAPGQSRGNDNARQQATTSPVRPYSDSAWAGLRIRHMELYQRTRPARLAGKQTSILVNPPTLYKTMLQKEPHP